MVGCVCLKSADQICAVPYSRPKVALQNGADNNLTVNHVTEGNQTVAKTAESKHFCSALFHQTRHSAFCLVFTKWVLDDAANPKTNHTF